MFSMYKLKYSKQAIRMLRKMPRNLANNIQNKIKELAQSPFKKKHTKILRGINANRLKIGNWRVIYIINQRQLEIWIVKIASRGERYK